MLATKENVARLSILSVSLLIIMKAVASIITGSIAIRADAVHSVIDLSGVIIGYIGIKISGKPPDAEHAFGHGKAEHIAGGVIGGLIFIAAGTIFYQAIRNLISGATVELVPLGIYVTLAAIVINVTVSRYALSVARSTDSPALEASARDLFADVLSSCAVLAGLVLVQFTGISRLDPIVALLVAVIIVRTAFLTVKKSILGLMDTRLPGEEEDEIISCIREHTTQLAGFHKVRTRKAGSQRFIDFHLMLPKNMSLDEAHLMCDHLEKDIENRLPHSSATIHVEPCGTECEDCLISSCSLRIGISRAGKNLGHAAKD
ncbi:MAG: cation diffusion facilitator family transporter [Candidatus Aminicenantales bacterium]